MSRPTVAVVGLGAVGSATALHLARAGAAVIGYDRWRPPHRLGSTHGESRITRATAWEGRAYVPLVARAQKLWDAFARETGQRFFSPTGGLFVGHPHEYHVAGSLRSAQEAGVAHAVFHQEEMRRRWPWLHVPEGMVGFWDPAAGVLAPERIVAAQLSAAAASGATLCFDTPVLGIEPNGTGASVVTAQATRRVDAVVVCAGGWASELLGDALPALPVERVTQHWFAAAADPAAPGDVPVLLLSDGHDHATAVFPASGGRIKVAGHGSGRIGPIEALDRELRADDIAVAERVLRVHLPSRAGAWIEGGSCFYTRTPSGHFLIDRLPGTPQIVVAAACNGFGFKFSVAVGEAVAALALGATPPVDVRPWGLGARRA